MEEKHDGLEWLNYDRWSEERIDLDQAAARGLEDGDLRPLAEYIRAGFVIGEGLARMIADAIEAGLEHHPRWGVGPVKLTAQRLTKDRRPYSVHYAEYRRNLEIGIWVEKRLRAEASLKHADAVSDAVKQFAAKYGVKATTIKRAHKDLKRQMSGDFAGFPTVDLVTLSMELPEFEPGKSLPKRRVRPT